MGTPLMAQKPLDTLYANHRLNMALFFPRPIEKAITGSPNYVFSYDRDDAGHLGLLQATPGPESNLFVVTNDGSVYSYVLKYGESLSMLYHFVDKADRIGTEAPEPIRKDKELVRDSTLISGALRSQFLDSLLKPIGRNIATERYRGLKMKLNGIVHVEDNVYLPLHITNRSGIDFEVDYLKVFLVNGNTKTKSSYQRMEQFLIEEYRMPKVLMDGQSYGAVLVLPKWVMGRMERLEIELKEKHGHRKLLLKM